MAAHAVDRLIHAAAVTAGPERDAADPGGIAEINLVGTIRALEAARERGLKRVVHVGTGAVYGDLGVVPGNLLDEASDLPRPVGMYPIASTPRSARSATGRAMGHGHRRRPPRDGIRPLEYETARRPMACRQTVRLAIRGEEARILRSKQRDWIWTGRRRRPDRAPRCAAAREPGVSRRHRHAWTSRLVQRLVAAYRGSGTAS
jgi:nucleoside-diphosphate-sugar epimerase